MKFLTGLVNGHNEQHQKEKNINAWKRLFPCQLYADGAYGEDTIIQNLSCAERLLIRAVQEQKYVMFYC